jgi:hypothetical protein
VRLRYCLHIEGNLRGAPEYELSRLRRVAYNLIGVMSMRVAFTKRDLRDERERERMGTDYDRFEKLSRTKKDGPDPPFSSSHRVTDAGCCGCLAQRHSRHRTANGFVKHPIVTHNSRVMHGRPGRSI